ncbi:MAG: DUF488 domain-containing protein [Bacteroidetes bacterium]|nr:DUF488 domain-containing protein [Bacteroidota bacterium]
MNLNIKRIYELPDKADGIRILVDRLWPRGMTKDKAHIDAWLKDIAPSHELRKWFHHDPKKWEGFIEKYRTELKANKEQIHRIKEYLKKGPVTLLYAAKDELHNEARVIKELLEK